ncbi:metallophosphoesterase [Oceanobacillus piezotolerans]|uniref:Metallophosphoesterase n=1 Tax=Oceanobacillus piezotolerans TaxID=2448030 RepID=A0A498DB15_9BACI|nr:metallophosphoesterase [Oceanobacillus piezotolerans]RLL48181.1 metallophosphoesterase [Oceanobacillus piezotolerans]
MKKTISIIIIIMLFPVFLLYMLMKAHRDKINVNIIEDCNLPDVFHEFTIFFITDIHRRRVKDSTLSRINLPIDIVVIGGDLTEKNVPLKRTKENIRKLKRWNAPIYFVWGNNDREVDSVKLISILRNEGVIILADDYSELKRSNSVIDLIGFDYSPTYESVTNEIIAEKSTNAYKILITHTPQSFYHLPKQTRSMLNLVLAGHTHGGQIRIAGFGPYERGALQKRGKTHILVSEGYGYTILPFRLGTNAECHTIKLMQVNQ